MAALEEMERRGLKFTMDDITRRLHISKTSLYKMVPSKTALIHGVIQYQIDESRREEKRILSEMNGAEEKLRALVYSCTQLFGFMGDIHDELRFSYEDEWTVWEAFRKEKIGVITSLIQLGAEERIFRKVNPALVQTCLIAAVSAVASTHFLREHHLAYEDAIDRIMDVVLYGIKRQNPMKKLASATVEMDGER